MDQLLDSTIEIVREAGEAIMQFFQESFSVTEKAPDNPLTEADLAADKLLHEGLLTLVPESGWLSEETTDSSERLERELVWVVDPLDGTKEFVLGIPEFTVSVALVESGNPLIGVVFNPATGEMYYTKRGSGTFLNDRAVLVSRQDVLSSARVDASRSERKRGEFEPFETQMSIRTVGSIAYKLARVAAGQADATWSRGPKNEWDICAGSLLVTEAGGRCADLDNQLFSFNRPYPKVNGIMATNGSIHEKVVAALAPHRADARVD